VVRYSQIVISVRGSQLQAASCRLAMPLVPGRDILADARQGGYAVGAFNFNNLEQLQAIVEAAKAERSAVFLATSEGAIHYAGVDYLVALARTAAASCPEPLVLHLDHGRDLELIAQCINAGYTSVMIDASNMPYEENRRVTRLVAEMAHRRGVSVEAELGKLKGVEDIVSVSERDAVLVDPEQAQEFVKTTGIDSLAPAIGTAHGAFKFKGEAKLDFDRLARVRDLSGIPLVLHGASNVPEAIVALATRYGAKVAGARGVPTAEIQRAIRLGVCKVNVDTDLRLALVSAIRQVLTEQPAEIDPRRILGSARDAMTEIVRARIRAFRMREPQMNTDEHR
jgi:fructose-bisphosphate aldolase class II